METHGGYGAIYNECYAQYEQGTVLEKDPAKSAALAQQRPTWSVYECECINAVANGAGSHLPINFVDIDPYGEPWPVIDALFQSKRPWPAKLVLVVNDGLRQMLGITGGWNVESMRGVVEKYGNAKIHIDYLDVCQELVKEKAGQAGYTLTGWGGYYCGHTDQITHYAAVLER